MSTINTINVGGVDKEIEDTFAREASENAYDMTNRLGADVAGLHTQVNQIIAPSGEAPNPSEVTDARIGADDTVYDSLGIAIRTQIQNVNHKIDYIDNIIRPEKVLWNNNQVTDIGLNNNYVWMPINIIIPKDVEVTIDIPNTSVADLWIYLFEKNENGTFKNFRSLSVRTKDGTTSSSFKTDRITYIGFYSINGGICYSTDSRYTLTPFYRCSRSSLSDETEFTYVTNMSFFFVLSYKYTDSITNSIVTVRPDGSGTYKTIIDAITNEPDNTPIIVYPGVYEQDMETCLCKRIILIGTDRDRCIIRDINGRYGHHPLYISCGYFENLTIESKYVSGESQNVGVNDMGSYAVHIDTDEDYAIGKYTEFHHCTLRSDFFPALGVGLRKDVVMIIDDCILENNQIVGRGKYSDEGSLGAFYVHDSNGEQGNQYLIIKDSIFKSKLKYAMCFTQVDRNPQNNRVYCDFINNVAYSESDKYTDTVFFRGEPFDPNTGIYNIRIGYGNSSAGLNN